MNRFRVLRVGWEAATVVWLVASLVLMVIATKQVLTGMRLAFSVERLFSSVDWDCCMSR